MKVGWSRVGEDGRGPDGRGPATDGMVLPDLPQACVPRNLQSRYAGLRAHVLGHEFLVAVLLVAVTSTIVIAPMLVLGTVAGRDFPFHLASWMDVARQWHHGNIYPRWAELANWGFGEPRFVFYPPGSWMLGAALGSVLPWKMVPTLFVWLVLTGAGVSMFLLARECMSSRQAILVAMLFAANPYHLLLVYYRSDFAELLASVFFPLLPWGVMRIAQDGWRRVPILALVVAAIWLSNAPAAVIAVYSLVFLFGVAYAVQRDRPLLMHGSAALAGGFGLAAFYILPAARERAWVQINQVLTDGLRPEQNFLFTRASSLAVNTDFNLKISLVVLLTGVVAAVAACYLAKSSATSRLQYALLVALGAMSFFMMFSLSRPLWVLAPELHFVQFPWRFAVPFAVAFAFLVGAVAGKTNKLAILAVGLFVLAGPLAKILLAIEKPSSWSKAEISQFQQSIDKGIGYRGTPEYLPNGSTSKASNENSVNGTAISSEGSREIAVASLNRDGETIRVQSPEARPITLKLFDYPTWQVNLDSAGVSPKLRDSDGHIVVAVPAGDHIIHVFMQRPWDAKVGMAISIATVVALSSLAFLPWRKEERLVATLSRFKTDLPVTAVAVPVLPMREEKRN